MIIRRAWRCITKGQFLTAGWGIWGPYPGMDLIPSCYQFLLFENFENAKKFFQTRARVIRGQNEKNYNKQKVVETGQKQCSGFGFLLQNPNEKVRQESYVM